MGAALQCVLGIQCNEFAMIAADQINTLGNCIIMRNDVDKLHPISEKLIMGVTGDPSDALQLTEFVKNNIELYKIKNGYKPSIQSTIHFTRINLADAVRTEHHYSVAMLVAGYDDDTGGLLYYLDALATCVPVPYAAHGIAGLFATSILEHYYKPTMSEMEAYEVIQLCVSEIHRRQFLNLPNFQVKVVNKNGITTLPSIRTQPTLPPTSTQSKSQE